MKNNCSFVQNFVQLGCFNPNVKNMFSFKFVTASNGRQNFPALIKQIHDAGEIVVLTQHGKPKVAMMDFDLLEELIENEEFGITYAEIEKRAKEAEEGKTYPIEKLKKKYGL